MPKVEPKSAVPKVVRNPFVLNWKNIILGLLLGTTTISSGIAAFYYFQLRGTSQPPELKPPTASPSATPKPEQPTVLPDETANWEVYANTFKDKTFSFKHPKSWKVSVEIISKEAGHIDYVVKKGNNKVTFWNNRPRGATISGPSEIVNQKYDTKVVQVKFDGKTVAANELTSKGVGSWEIFPQDISSLTFAFDLYSPKVPSGSDRSTMLLITSTFKFLD